MLAAQVRILRSLGELQKEPGCHKPTSNGITEISRNDLCLLCIQRGWLLSRNDETLNRLDKITQILYNEFNETMLLEHYMADEEPFRYLQSLKQYDYTPGKRVFKAIPLQKEYTGFSLADLSQYHFLVGTEGYLFKPYIRRDFDNTLREFRRRLETRFQILMRIALDYNIDINSIFD